MNKLKVVQKALRDLGVKFKYKEEEVTSSGAYRKEFITSITFEDSLGNGHEVVDQDFSYGRFYYIDGNSKSTQKDITKWIERNEILLTNREASIEVENKMKKIEKEYEEGQEVVDEKEFSSGNHTLKVTKRKNEHVELSINRNTRDRYVPYMYVGKNDNGEDVVSIGTVSYGTLGVEEGEVFIKEWSKALETAKHFENIIKYI